MYYDPNKTLSRQRLFNFVIGSRGCGKTYGCKKHVINNFLKKGEQFVYLRRYDTEIPASQMRNFFDDVCVEFPDVEFKSFNGLFRINGKIAGWYFPLSKATMLKSIPFPNVSVIIFDEFIIEVGLYRYLGNEVRAFLEAYSTISRDRDIPVLFLSNAITMANPYFLYFDIKLEKGQKVKLTEFISLELVGFEEFTNHMQQTKFGRLIAGTEYGNYNMENKFLLDTETFIQKMPPECGYLCTFIIKGKDIGYYTSPGEGLFYLSDKADSTCPRKFTLNFETHNADTVLAQKQNPYVSRMLDYYCRGQVRFTTQEVKNVASDAIKRMI